MARRVLPASSPMEAMEFRRAAAETRAIWTAGNQYLQRAAPWSAISADMPAATCSLRTALNLACLAARISAPFLPHTAQTILDAFGVADHPLRWPATPAAVLLDELPRGKPMGQLPLLFRRIEDAETLADEGMIVDVRVPAAESYLAAADAHLD